MFFHVLDHLESIWKKFFQPKFLTKKNLYKYVVLIGDLGKRVFYFCDFRPLRGLTGVTKFRDFGKFALDQDTFDGYNFFISRDNGIIPIVLER